jgi:sugar phosphate isomerase/epimerase
VSGLVKWDERGSDDYLRAAEALNTLGQSLRPSKVALQYHNHDFEFLAIGAGATGMDILLDHLDFGSVGLCFDAGWAAIAGVNPSNFMRSHAEKIGSVHLRDFAGDISVPLGMGDLNNKDVIDALPALPNLRAVMVEQDPGADSPINDMSTSRKYLRTNFAL